MLVLTTRMTHSLFVHIYPSPHSIVEDTIHLSLLICTERTIFNSKRLYLLVQLAQSDESLSGSTQSNHHLQFTCSSQGPGSARDYARCNNVIGLLSHRDRVYFYVSTESKE